MLTQTLSRAFTRGLTGDTGENLEIFQNSVHVWKQLLIHPNLLFYFLYYLWIINVDFLVSPHLTWRAFRGSERGDRVWPCSTRYCFHTASDLEPWLHASDSCHSRGCASKKRREQRLTGYYYYYLEIWDKSKDLITILCLYSSDASCTAVSQALEPLA